MNKNRNLLFLIICTCLVNSCASVVKGTLEDSQNIVITSKPSGLKIYSNLAMVCTTPCTLRGTDINLSSYLMVRNDQGEEKKIDLKREFSSDTVGNIIYGGGPGIVFDFVAGNSRKYPSKIYINFEILE